MTAENLFQAVKQGDRSAVAAILDRDPGLLEVHDPDGLSVLLVATYYGRKEIVGDLLGRRPRVTIFEAAAAGVLGRVRQALDGDPSLATAFSPDGYTALGLASFFGHLEVVNLLLGRGAEVNVASRNEMGVMPLHSAAAARHLAIAEVLIENGADVNTASTGGSTALHRAAENGQLPLVRLLLERGAVPDAADDEGVTARQLARKGNHIEVADLLRRRGG